MKTYLEQLPPNGVKKVCCFVTEHFPKPWMGGNRAISQMQRLCHAKNMAVSAAAVVNWTSKSREEQISEVVSKLSLAV
jgi:hypothetical protein